MADKRDAAENPKKSSVERATSKVRGAWGALSSLAKKAKNHWQMRPAHKNWDGTDPEVSLEDVRQGCPEPGEEEEAQSKKEK
ncbi:hypothetical protein PRZ48_005217 [Zasmidium cellare]|uniref:Uncharacterized protein n=1 Tax=Zasmidium cellare TaxID=395010 RepID=A0ABR0ERU1_ZASCE|nr:hypothetical protein PRZ48_005217 [Zasmidium cellare]